MEDKPTSKDRTGCFILILLLMAFIFMGFLFWQYPISGEDVRQAEYEENIKTCYWAFPEAKWMHAITGVNDTTACIFSEGEGPDRNVQIEVIGARDGGD